MIDLPMFALEDQARLLDPEAPLLAPRGQNPMPLADRIADLCASGSPDAAARLRAIRE